MNRKLVGVVGLLTLAAWAGMRYTGIRTDVRLWLRAPLSARDSVSRVSVHYAAVSALIIGPKPRSEWGWNQGEHHGQ